MARGPPPSLLHAIWLLDIDETSPGAGIFTRNLISVREAHLEEPASERRPT
jgi:hypothetical protein